MRQSLAISFSIFCPRSKSSHGLWIQSRSASGTFAGLSVCSSMCLLSLHQSDFEIASAAIAPSVVHLVTFSFLLGRWFSPMCLKVCTMLNTPSRIFLQNLHCPLCPLLSDLWEYGFQHIFQSTVKLAQELRVFYPIFPPQRIFQNWSFSPRELKSIRMEK